MSWRFYRRLRIMPGLRLNLSKRGASVGIGRRGAWFTMGRRPRATVGLPGTGLSYSVTAGQGGARPRASAWLRRAALVLGLLALAGGLVILLATW